MKHFQLALVLALIISLGSILSGCTGTPKNIPIDYEHVGSDAEYRHGDHCIDGRSF